jgi:hypothetical protein
MSYSQPGLFATSPIARQLAESPMGLFAIGVEHALEIAFNHSDGG